MLDLDLMQIETWQRFERFCCVLARTDFPEARNFRGSWDGGRDIYVLSALGWDGDIVRDRSRSRPRLR